MILRSIRRQSLWLCQTQNVPFKARNIVNNLKVLHNEIVGREFSKMTESDLAKVKDVDIDDAGKFKYILMKVYAKEKDGHEPCKMIVRGYKDCGYHSDIYDRVTENELSKLSLEAECVGGGRIIHENDSKNIKIFGYSQGYGKADHQVSASILKKVYKDYDITWSDEGY